MADKRPAEYAYTQLSKDGCLVLEVAGQKLPLINYTGSFAINQIPEATASVGIGRDVYNPSVAAQIHSIVKSLKTMSKARVLFTPSGDFDAKGTKWPEKQVVIFEGFYVGYGRQKVRGKICFACQLTHWMVDLAFTSALSSAVAPGSPASLTFPAVMEPFQGSAGGTTVGGGGAFVSAYVGHEVTAGGVQQDLWASIKNLFYGMATYDGFNPVTSTADLELAGVDVSQLKHNHRAVNALARIEGPVDVEKNGVNASLPYDFGMPLPLDLKDSQSYNAVADFVGNSISGYDAIGLSQWDLLINTICPAFGLDILPAVDRGVVVARLPGYRGKGGTYYRTITADEYEFVTENAGLNQPLRAVVCHGAITDFYGTSSFVGQSGDSGSGGVFASSADGDGDGCVKYFPVPPWLSGIVLSGLNGGASVGVTKNEPIRSSTTPASGQSANEKTPGQMQETTKPLLNQYARVVYVSEALRGRSSTITGKLRFDIAPGSHVKLEGQSETFLGVYDDLETPTYAQVNRVTVEIDAEAQTASTSMMLTHSRDDAENKADRTSADSHPFFGQNVCLGLPLVPELRFEPKT